MRIATDLAGYTLSEADEVRKILGKKLVDKMPEHEEKFISGCVKNNVPLEIAQKIWNDIVGFAKYSFNKSHSTAYALLAYQTAYLKANYPLEYMCSVLNSVINKQDKLSLYLQEVIRMGIKILPPDVNKSDELFTIEGNSIRYGLSAIKGISKLDSFKKIRPIKSIYNIFKNHLEKGEYLPNKNVLTALIEAKAFSQVEEHNINTLLKNTEKLYELVHKIKTLKRNQEYIERFNNFKFDYYTELPIAELKKIEKERLGICLSQYEGEKISLTGFIDNKKEHIVKNGKNKGRTMLIFTVEGQKCILFPDKYDEYRSVLKENNLLAFKGEVDKQGQVIVNHVKCLF